MSILKVLIADDDTALSTFVRTGLIEVGHTVDVVDNGRDALNHCLYEDYDVLILDRNMPNMDGLAVLKALKAARYPSCF